MRILATLALPIAIMACGSGTIEPTSTDDPEPALEEVQPCAIATSGRLGYNDNDDTWEWVSEAYGVNVGADGVMRWEIREATSGESGDPDDDEVLSESNRAVPIEADDDSLYFFVRFDVEAETYVDYTVWFTAPPSTGLEDDDAWVETDCFQAVGVGRCVDRDRETTPVECGPTGPDVFDRP